LLTCTGSDLPSQVLPAPVRLAHDGQVIDLRRGLPAMASIVRCWRVDPAGSPAALVAAWLIDVMAGIEEVRLRSADQDSVVLDVTHLLPGTRDLLDRAFAEPRFAGWQLLE
jgi:hypothetical protein